jgi:hypothetical protein
MSQNLIKHAGQVLLNSAPKRIVLSGPSGFLGSRVLDNLLEIHQYRSVIFSHRSRCTLRALSHLIVPASRTISLLVYNIISRLDISLFSIGEVVLLSSSPGTLMKRLSKHYGIQKISTVRASRVDYYSQHKISVWRNHLG